MTAITDYPNGIPDGVQINPGDTVRIKPQRRAPDNDGLRTVRESSGVFVRVNDGGGWHRTSLDGHAPKVAAEDLGVLHTAETDRLRKELAAVEAHRTTLREMVATLERQRAQAVTSEAAWRDAANRWKGEAHTRVDADEHGLALEQRDGWAKLANDLTRERDELRAERDDGSDLWTHGRTDPEAFRCAVAGVVDPIIAERDAALADVDRLRAALHLRAEREEERHQMAERLRVALQTATAERDAARARVETLERLKAAHWGNDDAAILAARVEAKAAIARARVYFEAALTASRQAAKDARNWGRWYRALLVHALERIGDLEREAALCNRGCQTW